MKKFYIVLIGLLIGFGAGVDTFAQQTWYAINSGDWNDPVNWTLDPAAGLHITEAEGYPLAGDNVVIKSGKNITMPEQTGDTPFAADCNVLTVDGRLDLKNTTGHSFTEIRGTGRILMEGDNFPDGEASHFVGEGQGTVVFKGGGYTISPDTFYNVEIDLTDNASKVNLAGNLTVNGNFSVLTGNFQFGNDATSRTLTVNGDVAVNNGGAMTVTTSGVHNMIAGGDITNNGTIKFTNQSQPDYDSTPATGYVILTAGGESNTTLTANNTTFLQRLIVDKGSDRTYRFTVNPSQKEYFRLFGQNNNAVASKALVINNGTLELTGATYIHSLTEGGEDFFIPEAGGFWINGGAVEVNATAVSNIADGFEATGVESDPVGSQSFSVLGLFKITDGTLNTRTHGFVAWDSGNALVQIEGGAIYTPGFRSAGGNAGRWTYNQSDGTVFMYGDLGSDLSGSGEATFSVKGTNNVFIMTGGTMEIQDAATGNELAVDIESGEGKYSVTGGTVKINRIAGASDDFNISSTAPFFNFEIAGVSSTATALLDSELTVLNDLIIKENGILDVSSNNYALNIGRNLTLESGSSIDLKSNLTSFTGSQNSIITVAEGLTLDFNDVDVNKQINYSGYFEVSSSGSGVSIDGDLNVTRGNFVVSAGGINIGGNIFLYDGNISGGTITLNGNTQQTLYSKYRKEKSIGDFNFDNTASRPQILLASDLLVNSLSFNRDQVVMLGNYNLELANGQLSTAGWGNSRMFASNGRASNGGLTLPVVLNGSYNDDIAKYFPIGYTVDGDYYFTPATVRVNGALNDSGSINVKHVAANHPTVDDPDGVVPYYWKTSYSGLSSLGSSNMRYIFTYVENIPNVPSGRGMTFTADNEWYDAGNDVRDGRNLDFDYGDPLLTDYTYGKNNAFNNVRTLYSLTDGPFNQSSTWTENADHQGSSTNSAPRPYDMVVVGGANGDNHTVSISGDERASQVYIKGKSETGIGAGDDSVDPPTFEVTSAASGAATYNYTLRRGWSYESGNEFSSLKGKGRFLIYGDNIPSADFSEFCNGNEAIFEYTGIGAYSIPESSYVTLKLFGFIDYGQELIFELNQYPNLHITESGTKTAGDIDLTVYGNLFVDDATFNISNQNNGDLYIASNLEINTGNLVFPSTERRVLNVDGDFFFSGDGGFYVSGGGSAIEHSVNLYGNLMQESGAIDLAGNTAKANIYFIGSNFAEFSKSGTDISNFNRIYINKPIGEQVLFSGNFNLNNNLNNDNTKTLVLQSGNASLDNSAINIELSSGGGMYKIPAKSELIVNQGTVSLGGGDPDGAGIWLDGKLTINDAGVANFNQGTDNYIEYTASGKSEIEVNGSGELYVGSQVRRSPYTDAGILKFSQNSDLSTIEIGTNDEGESTRGVFEILNAGSSFTQAAGATLTIKNSKNGGFTDFYFDPETVSLGDGSAINIAAGSETTEPLNMYLNKPLENLTFTGAVVGQLQTVSAEMLGNLTIGSGAEFDANGLDVTIHGNMTNEGTYSANGNTTFFNGTSDQIITGNTAFFNLEKNGGAGTLQVEDATSVTVENDLTLLSGVLNTGVNDLNVEGDVTIAEGTSTESNGGNGIVMNGTSPQNLFGGGTIARMMIDNEAGVVVPTQSSEITFSEVLKLNNGVLDIGKNLLAFTTDATITGSGDPATFSAGNMIQTNISFTDAGIIKYYPVVDSNNSPYSFTYPIGARGKYTPVVMDVTENANAGGSIRITAADEPHVTVTDPGNALNYNWTLDAVNLTGFSAHATMDALATDAPGATDNYILARIRANDSKWEKGLFENFSLVESNSIARLYFRLENGNISGDYTAGTNDAIPNDVPVYKTIQSGDWNDGTIWEKYEDGVATGVTGEVPEGSIVYIKHPVAVNVHGRSAFRTIIDEVADDNGVLNLGTTLNHRLGAVSGTGELVVASGSLPAGQYVDFFSVDGGTLEYSGNTNYSVLAELPQVNNLTFSGSGQRLLPNLDVDILGDLTIAGGDVVNEESRLMTIRGDLSATGGTFDPRQGKVVLRGSGLQTVTGNFTDDVNRSLYNMEVDNTSGITLTSPVEVENIITFTNGVINTSNSGLLTILNSSNAAVVNASRLRYVNGPMQKRINGGTLFDFPVGDDYRYGNIGVKPQTTGLWTAQYFDQAPTQTAGVTYVSQNEYWSVRSAGEDNAQIKLRWDAESGVNPDNPDFLVITRTTGDWAELSYVNKIGDVSGGTVYTEAALAHSTNERMFTFGSGSIEPFTWKGNALGAPDDWFTPANWTSNLVPSAANPAIVDDIYPTGPDPVIGEGMDAYCSTLEISEGRTVTVKKGASLEVSNSLSNSGIIVLESTNSNLSSLMLPEGATSGDVNVKLTLEANGKFYLSSPVVSTSLQDFYPDGDDVNDFVYVFREEPNWGWIRVNDSYLSDPVKAELGAMEAVAAMYIDGQALDYSGGVNTSNVVKESDGQGYFLLGNPYPVAIDWEDPVGWDRTGFGNTMYSYITIGGIRVYQTYNNGGDLLPGIPSLQMPEGYDEGNVSHIPAYQSVWLRQDVTGSMNITVKPSARVKESDAPLKSASTDDFTYNLIRIKADNDFLFDGTVIYFNDNFSESVGDEDSDKRFNSSVEVPELYTRISNRAYAINGLPALADSQYSIPLSVRNRVEGEVTLTFDLSQFNVNYEVFLEDRETGTWTNLREVNEYVYTPVQMGDDHDRFVLHFEQVQDVPTNIDESESVYAGGIQIIGQKDYASIQISPELLQRTDAVIEVLDMSGHVMNSVTTGSTKTEIELPESNGVYVVRVNAGGTVKTEKVVR